MRTLSAAQREIMRLRFADIPAALAVGGALIVPLLVGGVSRSAVSAVTTPADRVDVVETSASAAHAGPRSPVDAGPAPGPGNSRASALERSSRSARTAGG